MALLPEGLVVPPLPYAVALGVLAVAIGLALSSLQPRIDQRVVLGAVPWMVAGAAAHVFYQLDRLVDVYPPAAEPLAAAPVVYVTALLAFAGTWAALTAGVRRTAGDENRVGVGLAVAGTVATALLLAFAGTRGVYAAATPTWSVIGLVATVPLTAVAYAAMAYRWPTAAELAGPLGLLAVFAHALDGVTTTVGIDILGRAERSPLPEAIMDFAGTLPTAPYLGTGWLFVLVKLAVAVGIVVAFADYVEEDPARGNLLFGAVVVFGLGPAVNNLLLFALRDVGAVA
jgi:uncharacterized membrane protein